ncbi:MAG: polymerase sigma-B factor [Solirubrobacterales bacterium]|nr:polymerase sigma-B factor [Solirubrobacterales bacterium]
MSSTRTAKLANGPVTAASPAAPSRGVWFDEQTTDRLLRRYRTMGDERARAELIERMVPFARRLADRYRHTSQSSDDLAQVASLALVKAVDRFDPDRGVRFAAFAVPTILGELKRHFRDMGWSVRVPRGLQERALQVERTSAMLATATGRTPTVMEIAGKLEMTAEEVLEALEARQAFDALSMDTPHQTTEGEGITLGESLGKEDEGFEQAVDRAAVASALPLLPARDREIIRLRFVDELTQTEIAEHLGVSQMQVSRLLRRALQRLRELAES